MGQGEGRRKPAKDRTCPGHLAAALWLEGEVRISEELMVAVGDVLEKWEYGQGSIAIRADQLVGLAEAVENVTTTGPRALELWGWRKLSPRGTKRVRWEPSIREITLADLNGGRA